MDKSALWLSPLACCLAAVSLFSQSLGAEKALVAARQATAQLMDERHGLGLDERHGFRTMTTHTDDLGQTHVRLQQTYQGVPVWGGDYIAHVDEQKTLLEGTDQLCRGIHLDVQPQLSASEALAIAHGHLRVRGGYDGEPTATLMIYPMEGESGEYRLVYHVALCLDNALDGLQEHDYLIDAHSGAVLSDWNSLQTAGQRHEDLGTGRSQYNGTVKLNTSRAGGSYELRDTTRGQKGNTIRNLEHAPKVVAGKVYTDNDNTWGDGKNYTGGSTTSDNGQTPAVDAAYALQCTWDYYKLVHKRNGIDNQGKATFVGVHFDKAMDNAAWSKAHFGMVFGDGAAPKKGGYNNMTALDVVAHEFSHGVCGSSANLVYKNESGGLNEANSDINACMAEFHARCGGGNTVGDTLASTFKGTDGGNWTIGEQITQGEEEALRYMYKPSLDGKCPDFWYPELSDLDVHYSCGPMLRCFYFLSAGAATEGENSTATNTPAHGFTDVNFLPEGMVGVGNDKACRIWYRALTSYFTTTSKYFDVRKACQRAATELYGANSAELDAVCNAFAGVNVGNPAGKADDTTPPVVQNLTTSGGSSGVIHFTAAASDNDRVARVDFFVDKQFVGRGVKEGEGTWTLAFDSTIVNNGSHRVVAKAFDAYNNVGASTEVSFTTKNTVSRPIKNPSFEQGLTDWNQKNCDVATKPQNVHTGAKAAWLAGYGSSGNGSIHQTVEIPSNLVSASLRYWVKVVCKDPSPSNQDTMRALITDASGKTLATLKTFTSQDTKTIGNYTQFNADLAKYKGQKINLRFEWKEDAAISSTFYLDDVEVEIKTR